MDSLYTVREDDYTVALVKAFIKAAVVEACAREENVAVFDNERIAFAVQVDLLSV